MTTVASLLATSGPKTPQEKPSTLELCRLWEDLWKQYFPDQPEKLNLKEKGQLKMMLNTYGMEPCKRLIQWYFEMHPSLSYIKGIPSIGALLAFRRQLYYDMTHGNGQDNREGVKKAGVW